jgi:cell division inhibitor SepF
MNPSDPTRHEVSTFEDVLEPAVSYKSGIATIIHLNPEEKDVGRRIVDFFSGLAYGTNGSFEKVAEGIYLLVPDGASRSGF